MSNLTNASIQIQEVLKADSKAFNGIFLVSFMVFLAVALVAQLLTWKWRSWLPGAEGQKSLFGDVKSSVYTFMSYLN
jgi:light-harvesting complex 1 beta chain